VGDSDQQLPLDEWTDKHVKRLRENIRNSIQESDVLDLEGLERLIMISGLRTAINKLSALVYLETP